MSNYFLDAIRYATERGCDLRIRTETVQGYTNINISLHAGRFTQARIIGLSEAEKLDLFSERNFRELIEGMINDLATAEQEAEE